jgi:hypothetical protein
LRSAAALATPVRDAIESESAVKAPLLDRILSHPQDPERRHVALDLGRASQAMLDRLSTTRPCRIEVADFFRYGGVDEINRLVSAEDEDPASIERFLPPANDERLNLVFCWDLPNYLSLAALRVVIDILSRRAAPRCRLHMLIAYSKREMAEIPGRYIPGNDGTLRQILSSQNQVAAPRYSPEDINLALGNFKYERGVLLANGMQEFVYAWPDEPGADRPF